MKVRCMCTEIERPSGVKLHDVGHVIRLIEVDLTWTEKFRDATDPHSFPRSPTARQLFQQGVRDFPL